MDLNVFDFDYDATWAGLFLNADEKVYGRYGGRDAKSADGRMSLAGLRYALGQALAAHRADKAAARPARPPLLAENYPAAKRLAKNECIHCHQIYEFQRDQAQRAGTWSREQLWVYPLPENLGITLEIDQGNRVRAVSAGSPADRAGLQPGDVLQSLAGRPVASFADASYALYRAPPRGPIALAWQRNGSVQSASMTPADGWRKTNLTWRPSLLDLLPAFAAYGEDLSAAEKKALGLPETRLAFRQDANVHESVRSQGLQAGDVIIGIDNQKLDMTMLQFLGHVRQNYLRGDRITLNVVRQGKRLDLPMTLK